MVAPAVFLWTPSLLNDATMNLADIITAGRTRIMTTATSRKRALQQLADILVDDTPYLASSEIFTTLIARERLGSTGLGGGVALPHGRLKELDDYTGAMIRLPTSGVDFEAPDHQPVDMLFGLLVPQEPVEASLPILRGLATLFTTQETVAGLRAAEDEASLHALLLEHEHIIEAFDEP